MTKENQPVIKRVAFNKKLIDDIENWSYAKDLWPVVYILNDGDIKEAYVGETIDLLNRMNIHLKSDVKNKLAEACFITNDWFNKSATLDIESNLIKYISGDGYYVLQNANIGLANHNYYQKQQYWDIFREVWNKLRSEGIAKHSIEYIDNTDLFKYSPYKSLTHDQHKSIIQLLKWLLNSDTKNIIFEGGAGTGKTVLAIFLFKLLNTKLEEFNFIEFGEQEDYILDLVKAVKKKYPDPRMALVIPMASFRKTIKNVFRNVKGLNANMVVGPSSVVENKFDIIVVDEAHRLRRRTTLGTYFKAFDTASSKLGLDKNKHTELDWAIQQADKTILFYDEDQSIKPSDVQREDFLRLKLESSTVTGGLTSQLRVRAGNDYISFLGRLLNCGLRRIEHVFKPKNYELFLFDSIDVMIREIKRRNDEVGLSRIVAGYAWPWVSKNDPTKKDIHIDSTFLCWNSVNEDWVNSENAINEVGCIHTTQGYDLNFAGVIFGKEISYDVDRDAIVIIKENYYDRNGKIGVKDDVKLKEYILNIYKTLMLRAIKGTYIYVCDEKLRNYFATHIELFKAMDSNINSNLWINSSKDNIQKIPFYNLKAAAGLFSEEQKVVDFVEISLPSRYKNSLDIFACTVIGESMNKVIPNGSICLFRKYAGGSRNGKIVLVELTNLQDQESGSSYTVKEYHSKKIFFENEWLHESIELRPLTNAEGFEPILLTGTEVENYLVLGVFECVLENT